MDGVKAEGARWLTRIEDKKGIERETEEPREEEEEKRRDGRVVKSCA